MKSNRPVLTVRLTDGLATRNRLPLDHVLRVLSEVRGMLEDASRTISIARGVNDADLGLELVAGFRRGSVQADVAITSHVEIGVLAAIQVLGTVNLLKPKPRKRKRVTVGAQLPRDIDGRIVNRLRNIAKVQEIDKTRLQFTLKGVGSKPLRAVFDEGAMKTATDLRIPNFSLEGVTVFGKLRELRDRGDALDEDADRAFFGELVRDDGTVWRIEFKPSDQDEAARLFRQQVWITGVVTYYKAYVPKITVQDFGADDDRDYERAFDELLGIHRKAFGGNLRDLLRELRGEE